jgi:hypothetical protein
MTALLESLLGNCLCNATQCSAGVESALPSHEGMAKSRLVVEVEVGVCGT